MLQEPEWLPQSHTLVHVPLAVLQESSTVPVNVADMQQAVSIGGGFVAVILMLFPFNVPTTDHVPQDEAGVVSTVPDNLVLFWLNIQMVDIWSTHRPTMHAFTDIV
jgi:hypothetical protein